MYFCMKKEKEWVKNRIEEFTEEELAKEQNTSKQAMQLLHERPFNSRAAD